MGRYVVYHDNCPDGFTAAWVAKQHGAWADATYVPASYGVTPSIDAIPDGSDILFVDFCLSREAMAALAARSSVVTVLDHHKTAREALTGVMAPNLTSVFDMDRSGAGITWDVLVGGPRPPLVAYVEDRDLWRFKLPESHPINAYIMAHEREVGVWNNLALDLASQRDRSIAAGRGIMMANRQHIRGAIKSGTQWVDIGGYRVPVVNTIMLMSDLGNDLVEAFPTAAFAGYYFDRADGKRQFGLRSKAPFDVSTIAKQYGGGGHPQAAGFTVDAPFVF